MDRDPGLLQLADAFTAAGVNYNRNNWLLFPIVKGFLSISDKLPICLSFYR